MSAEQMNRLNRKKKKQKHAQARAGSIARPPVELPSWVPIDAWQGFCEMRHKGKRPFTAYAECLALRDLTALRDAGEDPRAVLEKSILRGWDGLFPVNGACDRKPASPTNGHASTPRSGLMAGIRERRQQRESAIDVDVTDVVPAAGAVVQQLRSRP